MGRNSINWNHVDVQQAIDDYICRKIPTQAKLRQLIGEILGSTISEQALSIYLKRTGVSFPRKTNSPHSNAKHALDTANAGELKSIGSGLALGDDGGGVSAALAVASLSVPHSLEHFYQPHHLFMSTINGGGGGAARNSAAGGGGGSPANAIAAVSSSTANANTSLLAVGESGGSAAANFVPVPTSTDFSNIINMSRNGGAGDALLGMSAAGGNNLHRYILDDPQQLHRAVEIQQNLQMQQQLAANHHWHHQQQQQQQSSQQQQQQAVQKSTASGGRLTGPSATAAGSSSAVKRPSAGGGSASINWKDPLVQNAIQNYFSRRIKLQTELRQVIMERLNRSISVNSLRAYLKKVKKQFEMSTSSSSSQHSTLSDTQQSASATTSAGVTNLMNVMNHLSTSASGVKDAAALSLGGDHHQTGLAGGSAADSVTVNVNPSREIYYVCNNLAGFATNSATGQTTAATAMAYASGGGTAGAHNGGAGGSTQQMLNSIESYNFAGDLVGKQLQLAPPTMVKTMMINEQMVKVSNSSDTLLHQQPIDHSQHPHHSQLLMSNGVLKRGDKDDSKPSVRRRINWNNAEVQNAIQDFYGRKILTQAKLRFIIESILGHGVSEQALSIYLKRKKTRNPFSEELLLMNINCDESIA